ncbi:hypothetical protein L2E82_47321 [Cichorium intybus]|uniref:Uncharacterized protein n=1 Tax=Cichorium intybus TaxID=13427 RepID=A0ACB8YW73_CICIN|nr:hypothetical protein L2E82_47321 [Cichorium intybus]
MQKVGSKGAPISQFLLRKERLKPRLPAKCLSMIHLIYASPAEVIWGSRQEEILTDSDLREIDLYSFQGLLKHEGIEKYGPPFRQWQKDAPNFNIDGHYPSFVHGRLPHENLKPDPVRNQRFLASGVVNVSPDDILLKKLLDMLAATNPNLKVFYTIDNPSKYWVGGEGYISKDMALKGLPAPSEDTLILVMGILKELGYTEEMNYNNPGCDSSIVTFGRRASSCRYVSYSRDGLHSEIGSTEFMNYTVHIPLTLDNQTMDPSISQRVEEQ